MINFFKLYQVEKSILEGKNKGWIEKWEKKTSAGTIKLNQEFGLKLSFRAKTMPEFAL